MRNKLSRVIALILAATMTVNMLPVSAIATTFGSPSDDVPPVSDEFDESDDDGEDDLDDDEDELGGEDDPDDEDDSDDADNADNANNNSDYGVAPVNEEDEPTVVAEITDEKLEAALDEAKTYIDALTINNASNDPATVVQNFKKHFTWDNETREGSKTHLFDWSYYNGVVFEGLEYVYEATGEEVYKNYVIEYMSSLINEKGGWATCTNDGYTKKECAGYYAPHGADTFKTASLLLDAYEMTKDSRYLTMAEAVYGDLAAYGNDFRLVDAGNNYSHTWWKYDKVGTDKNVSSPALWLDGLYMTLPFQAEYAAYIGDDDMLDDIVSRMQWVSDNMCDKNNKNNLFYHAADSATKNSGTHWLRAVGWYAAAIADVMDSMEGDNLESMKNQLVKVVDGMKAIQNPESGLWANNMKTEDVDYYETSGTALICYAVMKAVNEGWLDESYADMAELAFVGICDQKLTGDTLKDICFKGTPGSSNAEKKSNEGKGVGPFIMLYAEILKHETPKVEEPVEPEVPVVDQVVVEGVAGEVTKGDVSEEDKVLLEEKVSKNLYKAYIALDVSAELEEGKAATITIPIPADWADKTERIVGISIENGIVKEIPGTVSEDKTTFSFPVYHFSTKGIALAPGADTDGWVSIPSGYVYKLDTDGKINSNEPYLIVGSNHDMMLTLGSRVDNSYYKSGAESVNVTDDTIILSQRANEWYLGDDNRLKHDNINDRSLYHNYYDMRSGNSNQNWTYAHHGNGRYRLHAADGNGNWSLYFSTSYVGGFNERSNVFTIDVNDNNAVRLFKYEGPQYARLVAGANWTNMYPINTQLSTILANLSVQTSATKNTADATTVAVTADMITWNHDFNGNAAGTYKGTVSYNGLVLGTVTVTVAMRALNPDFTPILSGNTPVPTKPNVEPDFSKIQLEVKFDGEEETSTITVENGLEIEGYDITEPGFAFATISYLGVEYGTVLVTVEGNPFEGAEPADPDEEPEYPAEGAVRIDKTATHNAKELERSGLTHVELSVAGSSSHPGVDVVLVVDVSNSMAWSLENSGNEEEAKKLPNALEGQAGQKTKLEYAMESATAFAEILLGDNTGAVNDDTLSFVTFAGYDATFGQDSQDKEGNKKVVDSLVEVFRGETSADAAEKSFEETKFTEANTSYPIKIANTNGNAIVAGNNRGDTNYDYAFWQANQTVEAIKAANKTNGRGDREVYVVFMTDGAPSHYNGKNKNGSSGRKDNAPDGTSYKVGDKYTKDNWYAYISENSNTYAKTLYDTVDGNFVAIGFDLAHGGFGVGGTAWIWEEKELAAVLEKVAYRNKEIQVMTTASASELNEFYKKLANEINFAGRDAIVTDTIDSNFKLQMANRSGSVELNKYAEVGTQTITVNEHVLYTRFDKDANGNPISNELIGTRTGQSRNLETVTFASNGLSATSSELGNQNIMTVAADGSIVISAKYFTYTKTKNGPGAEDYTETFKWLLGNISDKEVTLGFNVYLKGALEGTAPKDKYYTNEEAILEYIDINDKYATKTFPVPFIYWKGASTTVRFYLVNEKGQPVNSAGEVVPDANRIYIGDPVSIELYLNENNTIDAQTIKASDVVPSNYFLYDNKASFKIQTESSPEGNSIIGGIVVSSPSTDAFKTTYDENGNATKQTGAQTTIVIDAESTGYWTWSTIGFGVRYDLTRQEVEPLVPDKVVIDYGKAIQVNVLNNDPVIPTFTAQLVGFVEYDTNIDPNYVQLDAGETELTTSNGTYSIVQNQVQFQPVKLMSEVAKVYCVVKLTESGNETNYHYRYEELDIIPATIMYYETDFATGVFVSENWRAEGWGIDTLGTKDNEQSCVAIGTDLYGYDDSYGNDSQYSNGTAYKVALDAGQDTKTKSTSFTFTGTGFDLISRTGTAQGMIKVEVTGPQNRTVTVLNKSDTGLELYQIPVVSVNGLPHGTYTVNITAYQEFISTAIPALYRGGQFTYDAVRIFDPIDASNGATAKEGSDTAIAYQAYVEDGEANNKIHEVRKLLLDEGAYEKGETEGISFVDRVYDTDTSGVNIKTYETIGPNNEVYLVGTQAIAFELKIGNVVPESIHIGAKSADGNAVTLNVATTVGDDADGITTGITSSTAQYYDIMGELVPTANSSVYVYINNEGKGVLSITDLKIGYGDGVGTVSIESSDELLKKVNGMLGYEDSSEASGSTLDVISAEFVETSIKRKEYATLKVTTSDKVESLTVYNSSERSEVFSVESVETVNGNKVWTLKMQIVAVGTKTFSVVGHGANGLSGASKEATIKVTVK